MKKLIFTLITIFLGIGWCYAINANEVLKKTQAKINGASSLTATFTVLSPATNGYAGGAFAMSKQKFSITGEGYGIWYDGKNMWSYSDQTGETSLSNPTPEELIEVNPFEIIKNYASYYKASLKSTSGGKYSVQLTATSKTSTIKQATIQINSSTWLPTSMDVTLSNGNQVRIDIVDITLDKVLSPNVFKYPYDQYPTIDIIDLR